MVILTQMHTALLSPLADAQLQSPLCINDHVSLMCQGRDMSPGAPIEGRPCLSIILLPVPLTQTPSEFTTKVTLQQYENKLPRKRIV